MSVLVLDQAWAVWMKPVGADGKKSQGQNWRDANPGQWKLLEAYRAGDGPRPDLSGNTGEEHVLLTDLWLALQDPDPPPPPPPPVASALFLVDAERDYGKPFSSLFKLLQTAQNSPPVQGKSHMVDAAWAKRNGRGVIRLSSQGYPSGSTLSPPQPDYERAQMGDKRTMQIGERACYGLGFYIPEGQDQHGQDLIFEGPFQNYRGPTQFMDVRPGCVEFILSSGETTLSGAPAYEVNTVGPGRAPNGSLPRQYAVPPGGAITDLYHRVLIDSLFTPDWTGWVQVHHMVEGGKPWTQTVDLQDVPTLQCLMDGKRTVPSLNISDIFNLYCIARPGFKEHDITFLGRWGSADDAKAELV